MRIIIIAHGETPEKEGLRRGPNIDVVLRP
jgi:hypothetical protein